MFPGSSGVACMPEDVSFAMSSSSFIMRRCVAIAVLWVAGRGGERYGGGGVAMVFNIGGGTDWWV